MSAAVEHSLADKNREVFHKIAKDPAQHGLEGAFEMLLEETGRRRHWISPKWTDTDAGKDQEVKLLDYACGYGAISRYLEPYITKAIGIDLAPNMVAEYNRQAREAGISAEKLSARVGNLLANPIPEDLKDPELYDFDVAIVIGALHHFEDPQLAVNRLAERLRKGGALCVLDNVYAPGLAEEHKRLHPETAATVHKSGFTEEEMRELFENAGLGDGFSFSVVERPFEMKLNGQKITRTIFLARGAKL
ncbi:hypothetical protein VTN31DRAFT_5242 [Thermomyces dupontii]|uniref:uncharacterized protein n=1 Tax=Talaromyces thermophilus TaxID=28565 RepID=UPI00374488B5